VTKLEFKNTLKHVHVTYVLKYATIKFSWPEC